MQVYQRAITEDPTYQAALSTNQATQENVSIAKGPLFPQLSLTGNVNRAKLNNGDVENGRGYSLTLTQSLVDYAQWQTLSQAEQQAAQADIVLQTAKQTLMLDVATAYFNVLEAQDNQVSAQAQVNSLKNNLDKVEQQHKVGVKPMSDVLDARSSYDQARADLIQKENDVATSWESLRAITGVKYKVLSPLKSDVSFEGPIPNDINHWEMAAKNNNLDMKKARFDAEIAETSIDINHAGHYPTLSLQLAYSYNRDPTGAITGVVGNNHNATINLVLSVPIFSGGLITAQTQQAINQYEAAHYDLIKAERSAVSSSRQNFLGMKAQLSSIRAFESAVKADETTVKTYEASYAVGVATMLDILRAIKNLNTDQQQLAKARYDYILDYLQLKNNIGNLTLADLEKVNAWLKS
ncbi:type I secretion protein TolC [Piscirickettsia litoralis]|uniref:Type I secretion protein TolC n=1 Tax=Piscirickettsia litoralis TaxID=1891921 RepID=A0ABX3A9A5_9GAMM|nr:type I secretion protein TolC [Piscirickettsia litoralis]